MAVQDYATLAQTLYVTYFGRPGDYFGMQSFQKQLNDMKAPTDLATLSALTQADKAGTTALSKLVNSFSASPEATAMYGTDTSALGVSKFVEAIYLHVLNRAPDAEGWAFWVDAITSGALPRATAAAAIADGAVNNTSTQGLLDAKTVANKIAVATDFTNSLVTVAQINGYAGNDAAAAARDMLAGVDAKTVVADFHATVVATVDAVVAGSIPSTTFTLTGGADTIVGTAGNDIINALTIDATGAAKTTLSGFDSIDGGAGKDTLNIYSNGSENKQLPSPVTVKNVETINIFNDTAAFTTDGTAVDASKFVGATAINQNGVAAAVTGLAATTVAGFNGVIATALDVKADAAATSASIALAVKGVAATNVATLAVAGAALDTVNVSGTIAKTTAAGPAASVKLNVTAGKDVETLSVKSAVKTTLAVTEGAGSVKEISTVDASASTGGITYDGIVTNGAAVATIKTGAGDDTVTIATVLSSTNKAATLSTGAGDDNLVVNVSGTGTATVDAGDGDDEIHLTIAAGVTYNVNGGAGDDTVYIDSGIVKTTDVIDGGAGNNTVALAGSTAYLTDDYIVLNKVLKNFQAVEFTSAAGTTTAIDASQIANYKTITFDNGGVITKVAADQALVAVDGTLLATAAGYVAGTSAAATTYAGTLNVTASGGTSSGAQALTANANILTLTVKAASGVAAAPSYVSLAGDVKTAIVTLANGVDNNDAFTVATLNVTTADKAVGAFAHTTLGNLSSLTLAGNGVANVINGDNTKLVTVDASALNSVGADGVATTGLVYASTNTAAETIKLGSGVDKITLSASTYGKVDSIQGLHLVVNAAGTDLVATSDILQVSGVTAASKFTTTQTDFDVVLKEAAAYSATKGDLVFQFGGDTYVFHDAQASGANHGLIDSADTVVKLVGTVDLDALIVSLAHTA